VVLLIWAIQVKSSDYFIEWNPVCRHDAIYWASVVRDQAFPVRFVFVRIPAEDGITQWHVQPQFQLQSNWYYFKVENETVIIISEPDDWEVEYIMSTEDYVDWLFGIERECSE
jgi:hypothetical protein